MPSPIATLTSTTATGDQIVAPGAPKRLAGGKPISCIGDNVTGSAITGLVMISPCTNAQRHIGGKPISNVGVNVNGVNPTTGAPLVSPITISSCAKRII